MPMPTPNEVRKKLAGFGGAEIDNFNQVDTGRAFQDRRLTEGYCEGVSLDWIRRVLQGGRPAFSPRAIAGSNPEHVILQKKQSQAGRQAGAYLMRRRAAALESDMMRCCGKKIKERVHEEVHQRAWGDFVRVMDETYAKKIHYQRQSSIIHQYHEKKWNRTG